MNSRISRNGFTLLEVVAAITVVAILIAILVPNFSGIGRRISKARCLSNMRSLHVGFTSYVNDQGYWPQVPQFDDSLDPAYEDWWLKTMAPYVPSDQVWICPVLKAAHLKDLKGNLLKMHYMPTQFDANRISPTRWPRQPWLIETADAHGDGALILFPDGAVQSLNQVIQAK